MAMAILAQPIKAMLDEVCSAVFCDMGGEFNISYIRLCDTRTETVNGFCAGIAFLNPQNQLQTQNPFIHY